MATATHAAAGQTGESQKKTVTVIAYAEDGAFKSERDMANQLDPQRDYYERTRRTSRTVELVATDDDGEVINREKVFCDDVRDALVEGGVGADNLEVNETVEVSRPYKRDPARFGQQVRDDAAGELPDMLSGGVERTWWSTKWQDADDVTRVRIRGGSVGYRRPLAHRTRRNGRRKYDPAAPRKHLSVEFTIELGTAASDLIETWSEEVVAAFVRQLANLSWTWKVRVAACTETVEREGDCFDL